MFAVQGVVQTYAWGATGANNAVTFFASRQGRVLAESKPRAELWLGAHPQAPAIVTDVSTSTPDAPAVADMSIESTSSDRATEISETKSVLASRSTTDTQRSLVNVLNAHKTKMPFLLKVLSLGQCLSIQVHPDRQAAQMLHQKNPELYPDPYDKPETLIPLSDEFQLFCGFMKPREIFLLARAIPFLNYLVNRTRPTSKNAKPKDDVVEETKEESGETINLNDHASALFKASLAPTAHSEVEVGSPVSPTDPIDSAKALDASGRKSVPERVKEAVRDSITETRIALNHDSKTIDTAIDQAAEDVRTSVSRVMATPESTVSKTSEQPKEKGGLIIEKVKEMATGETETHDAVEKAGQRTSDMCDGGLEQVKNVIENVTGRSRSPTASAKVQVSLHNAAEQAKKVCHNAAETITHTLQKASSKGLASDAAEKTKETIQLANDKCEGVAATVKETAVRDAEQARLAMKEAGCSTTQDKEDGFYCPMSDQSETEFLKNLMTELYAAPAEMVKQGIAEALEVTFDSIDQKKLKKAYRSTTSVLKGMLKTLIAGGGSAGSAGGWMADFESLFNDCMTTFRELNKLFEDDRSCFAAFILAKHTLKKGQAFGLAPGTIHAYLKGECIEIMKCSDNVIRAGLTVKHRDFDALMEHTVFKRYTPAQLKITKHHQDHGTANKFEYQIITPTFTNSFNVAILKIAACSTAPVVMSTLPQPRPNTNHSGAGMPIVSGSSKNETSNVTEILCLGGCGIIVVRGVKHHIETGQCVVLVDQEIESISAISETAVDGYLIDNAALTILFARGVTDDADRKRRTSLTASTLVETASMKESNDAGTDVAVEAKPSPAEQASVATTVA